MTSMELVEFFCASNMLTCFYGAGAVEVCRFRWWSQIMAERQAHDGDRSKGQQRDSPTGVNADRTVQERGHREKVAEPSIRSPMWYRRQFRGGGRAYPDSQNVE